LVATIAQAVGLFAVTNIDDIIVLSLFFAPAAGRPGTMRAIAVGQYPGFALILAATLRVVWGAGAFLPPARPLISA